MILVKEELHILKLCSVTDFCKKIFFSNGGRKYADVGFYIVNTKLKN
jgi:hypothetical protein